MKIFKPLMCLYDKQGNMCDYCDNSFAACSAEFIKYGTIHNDNVIECASFNMASNLTQGQYWGNETTKLMYASKRVPGNKDESK